MHSDFFDCLSVTGRKEIDGVFLCPGESLVKEQGIQAGLTGKDEAIIRFDIDHNLSTFLSEDRTDVPV